MLTLQYVQNDSGAVTVEMTAPGNFWQAQGYVDMDEARRLTEAVAAAVRDDDWNAMRENGESLAQILLPPIVLDNLPEGGALLIDGNMPWVPWELLWSDMFLCVRFALSRKPAPGPQPKENPVVIAQLRTTYGTPLYVLQGDTDPAWGCGDYDAFALQRQGASVLSAAVAPGRRVSGFLSLIQNNLYQGLSCGQAVRQARLNCCFDAGSGMDWACFAYYGYELAVPPKPSPELMRVLARAAGMTRGNWLISTSPLFSALLIEGGADIRSALRQANVNHHVVEAAIALLFDAPVAPIARSVPPRERWSDNALAAMDRAGKAAAAQGRDSVTTNDLFVALLSEPCMLTSVLAQLGVDSSQLIAALNASEDLSGK